MSIISIIFYVLIVIRIETVVKIWKAHFAIILSRIVCDTKEILLISTK